MWVGHKRAYFINVWNWHTFADYRTIESNPNGAALLYENQLLDVDRVSDRNRVHRFGTDFGANMVE